MYKSLSPPRPSCTNLSSLRRPNKHSSTKTPRCIHVKPKLFTSLSSFAYRYMYTSICACRSTWSRCVADPLSYIYILFTFISNHVSIFAICPAQFTRDLAIIFTFGKPPSAWKINSIPCLGIFNSYLKGNKFSN